MVANKIRFVGPQLIFKRQQATKCKVEAKQLQQQKEQYLMLIMYIYEEIQPGAQVKYICDRCS